MTFNYQKDNESSHTSFRITSKSSHGRSSALETWFRSGFNMSCCTEGTSTDKWTHGWTSWSATHSGCATSSPLSNCSNQHACTCTLAINTCGWCSVFSFVVLRRFDAESLRGVCRRSLLICEEGKYGPRCQGSLVSSHTLVGVGRHVWCLQTAAAAETCESNNCTVNLSLS